MEANREYTIGRNGHIYIADPSVSAIHATIKIVNGKIYLRDMDSTNGTYLLKNKKLVYFKEGFVTLDQPIVIGKKSYSVRKFLRKISIFSN